MSLGPYSAKIMARSEKITRKLIMGAWKLKTSEEFPSKSEEAMILILFRKIYM